MIKTVPPPEQIVQAHQYLYYVLGTPILSDYSYDMYCSKHGIYGGGGSDRAADYHPSIRVLAERLLKENK